MPSDWKADRAVSSTAAKASVALDPPVSPLPPPPQAQSESAAATAAAMLSVDENFIADNSWPPSWRALFEKCVLERQRGGRADGEV